jgi:uncharacterized protein (DUF302 family)
MSRAWSIVACIAAATSLTVVTARDTRGDPHDSVRPRDPEISMAAPADAGIVSVPSAHSVDETVAALKQSLQARGVTLFALIDHSGEAAKVGMTMPPTKLLIFGNPKAGTPLMLAAPTLALDLPLKVLVWEDGSGKVWASYNSAAYLQQRHGVPQGQSAPLAAVESLVAQAAK